MMEEKTDNTIFSAADAHDYLHKAKDLLKSSHDALQDALHAELLKNISGKITSDKIIELSHRHSGVKKILNAMVKLHDGPLHTVERMLELEAKKD